MISASRPRSESPRRWPEASPWLPTRRFRGIAGRWWAHVDDDRYDDLPAAGTGAPPTDGPAPEPADPLQRSVLRIPVAGPALLRVRFTGQPSGGPAAVRQGIGLCQDAGRLRVGRTELRVVELWPDTAPTDSTVELAPRGGGPVELSVWGCAEVDGAVVAPTGLRVEEQGSGWRLTCSVGGADLVVGLSLE